MNIYTSGFVDGVSLISVLFLVDLSCTFCMALLRNSIFMTHWISGGSGKIKMTCISPLGSRKQSKFKIRRAF